MDDDGSPDGMVALMDFRSNPLLDVQAVTVLFGGQKSGEPTISGAKEKQDEHLAMIAAQHGMEVTSNQASFLMGFTYGATEIPGAVGLNPFTDPEAGFVVAAPYLGLERRYYTTDGQALYLSALRHYLSRGYAVRVALDVGVL